jgi:hypothetical protein
MMHPNQMFSHAQAIQPHEETALAAQAIVVMRGGFPFNYVSVPYGSMQAWQAVLLEAIMMREISESVRP